MRRRDAQAILADAGDALVDGGESLQDTGQALSDASETIGDRGMIGDATAQPAPTGGVCYVAWGDASSRANCGAGFTQQYEGRATVPFLRGGAGTPGSERAYARWSVGGSNVPLAAFGSTMCASVNYETLDALSSNGRVSFAVGAKWTSSMYCSVCCK